MQNVGMCGKKIAKIKERSDDYKYILKTSQSELLLLVKAIIIIF